jgi:hypothetical protein
MARDWRKVAFAMITAMAFAGTFAPAVESQTASRMAKAKAKAKEAGPAAPAADEEKAAAKKKQDPVEAQRTIDAAAKLIQTGKVDQATQSLTAVLNAGNLPPPIMAKALYTRGVAFRQKSQPAQAISDLTSALWLKGGLNEADRADALKQRAQAYADAGLQDAGTAVASAGPEAKDRPASSSKGWATDTGTPTQAAGGGNWFENLFGASAAPAPPPKAVPPPTETASIGKADPPPASEKLATRPRVSSAWSSSTEVHAAAPEPPRPAAPAAVSEPKPVARVAAAERKTPPPPAAVVPASGKYRVQLATVRTEEEAKALATKAKREHSVLASSQPLIDQTVLGNMGAFYRVRFGPYATVQETQAVCARLKGSGFDCLTVTQ